MINIKKENCEGLNFEGLYQKIKKVLAGLKNNYYYCVGLLLTVKCVRCIPYEKPESK